MKDAKISFRVFGDSGPLTLSWSSDAKGRAIEAKKGSGVGFSQKRAPSSASSLMTLMKKQTISDLTSILAM